jgi:RNA polymerase sigma-70 factor (ECF subfamily)
LIGNKSLKINEDVFLNGEETGMNKVKDNTELTEWVRVYTAELWNWAFRKTSNQQLSEDLVQDTFLAAAENMGSFRRESQPKTWLLGILKNKIAEHYRKAFRQPAVTTSAEEGFAEFFNSNGRWKSAAAPQSWTQEEVNLTDIPAFNKVFENCIEGLPGVMNACVRLRYLDEKKGTQICQELGLTITNYWQLIHRAKLHLRSCLEKNWFLAS